MSRFVALDVETPNSRNDRMSAIGIAVLEDGRIVDRFVSPVNPETYFDSFNVALTGISPLTVADAPTFGELWQLLRPLLESGTLLAHNAPFDLSVLAHCLAAYGIAWQPTVPYLCTVRMARRVVGAFTENHRLNTLCDYYGIPLDHHRAGSDAEACALLFARLCETADPAPFLRRFDLTACRTVPPARLAPHR